MLRNDFRVASNSGNERFSTWSSIRFANNDFSSLLKWFTLAGASSKETNSPTNPILKILLIWCSSVASLAVRIGKRSKSSYVNDRTLRSAQVFSIMIRCADLPPPLGANTKNDWGFSGSPKTSSKYGGLTKYSCNRDSLSAFVCAKGSSLNPKLRMKSVVLLIFCPEHNQSSAYIILSHRHNYHEL